MEPIKYFAGVEGGATHSNAVICDENGVVVAAATGPGTNHWALGMDACADRLLAMLREARQRAELPDHVTLHCLGLALSGCEQDSTNEELAARVKEKEPNCARAVYVASDTTGSLHTGAPDGGMVVIAGTGSNALLLSPDGSRYSCGGWGHLLGDEGGGMHHTCTDTVPSFMASLKTWWIARRAVKAVLDAGDGLRAAPHAARALWRVLQQYFQADTPRDLLPHAYQHFDKSKFAGVCEHIAELAALGDPLSRHVLCCAGAALGAHVAALCAQAGAEGALRVVCVGSVWKSWPLLKPGLLYELRKRKIQTQLEFVRLRVSSALGAASLAARQAGLSLPRDDAACVRVFHSHRAPGGPARGGDIGGGDARPDSEGCGCERWDWS